MSLNWGQYIFNPHSGPHLHALAHIKYILSPIKAAKLETAL
jgi:hypothetical protein